MIGLPDIWLSAAEIAERALPGLPGTKRGVLLLAERCAWNASPYARQRSGRGGGWEYHIGLLPHDAQRAVIPASTDLSDAAERVQSFRERGFSKGDAVREVARCMGVSASSIWRALSGPVVAAQKHQAQSDAVDVAAVQAAGLAGFERLNADQQMIAEVRAGLIRAVDNLVNDGMKLGEARDAVAVAWSAGEDDFGLGPDAQARVSVSVTTLKRWAAAFKNGGLAALAPQWGKAAKGRTEIDADNEVKTLIEGMILEHPDTTAKLVMQALRARIKGRDLPAYRSVQRWIENWKKKNAALVLMNASPDGFRSKARLVVGNASENVLRLNQRWEMDSTPNDVMLSDGNRHALIGVIDVWSRRVRLVVARTSSSAGVAACFRKGLLDWGVPEMLKCDNGSDYKSKHMARVCAGLEVEQKFCQPFNPQEKPHIERVFRTFSHGLVSLQAGFIGHNVEQRNRIEDRKAFASRIMDKEAAPVELRMSAQELQAFCDDWCTAIYEHEPHSTLGRSPFEQVQSWTGPVSGIENERALDVLLMPAPGDSGTRIVGKRGISIERWHYTDPALLHHWKQRVQVRLDEEDWGRVLILSEDGEFICWALCPERMGVSRAEAAAHFRKDGRDIEAGYRKIIAEKKRESRASTVAADIMDEARERAGRVVAFPSKPAEPHQTTALNSGAVAAAAKGQPRLTEKRTDVTLADVANLNEVRPMKRVETASDRFLRWQGIDERVSAAEVIDDADARFWRAYAQSPEYASLAGMIEEYGADAVLGKSLNGKAENE